MTNVNPPSSLRFVDMDSSIRGRRHAFFQRSDSTLCLGCPPPDPFDTPMTQSMPLADQPQLLQPNARKEDMFGSPKISGITLLKKKKLILFTTFLLNYFYSSFGWFK